MAAGSLTLGGNLSLAVGPLGRTGEASGALNSSGKMAAMFDSFSICKDVFLIFLSIRYSYSKTRGLFGGISIEGSVIVERQDANAMAYHSNVTAKALLSGEVERPEWASALTKTIQSCTGMPGSRQWVDDTRRPSGYAFSGLGGTSSESAKERPRKGRLPSFPPASWGRSKNTGSYFETEPQVSQDRSSSPPRDTALFGTQFESDFAALEESQQPRHRPPQLETPFASPPPRISSLASPNFSRSNTSPFPSSKVHGRSFSHAGFLNPFSGSKVDSGGEKATDDLYRPSVQRAYPISPPFLTPKPELAKPLSPNEGVARAVALYEFRAIEVSSCAPTLLHSLTTLYSRVTSHFHRVM